MIMERPSRERRVVGLAVAAVLVSLFAVVFLWRAGSSAPAAVAGYRVDAAGTTLVMVVETGPDD